MTDYRAMIEEHSCKPNQGCGVMTICMCGVAEDMADEIERLREAVTIALSALVAANSLLKRSEDEKVKPSRAVASNKIFRLMMADYERAVANARAALEQAQPVAAREKE